MSRTWPLGVLLLAAGCAVVRSHRIRSDYEQSDRQKTKRLVVVVAPSPEGDGKAAELLALISRRYVNQKRNFLVKQHLAAPQLDLPGQCAEGLEGVLWLRPSLRKSGEGVEGELNGQLLRCRDREEVWAGEAAGSFPSRDDKLREVTAQYVGELGPEVRPYVAPAFNLLRPLLDTLPNPELNDDDVGEKIELGE